MKKTTKKFLQITSLMVAILLALGFTFYYLQVSRYIRSDLYYVGLKPRLGDIKSWRTYDSNRLDGIGLMIGMVHQDLVGYSLKSAKPELLTHIEKGHYSWIITPGNKIIYAWNSQKSIQSKSYIRHSQIGRGFPVRCAGEFTLSINKQQGAGQPHYVISLLNNSSGHYRPNGQCLKLAVSQLKLIGVPVLKTSIHRFLR